MNDSALDIITAHARDGARLRETFFAEQATMLRETALRIAACLARGGKILLCGNGGSAADAQHLAAEFVNRFLVDRPALPALALTTDTSALTAIANDMDFSQVFSRQVEALGRKGDILVGISTSGNSPNVLAALEAARRIGMLTLGFTGRGGGRMAALCHMLVDVANPSTPLIQEIHITAGHLLCQLTDYYLFENVAALAPYLHADTVNED
uniref:Phosphoheptose isomerase n=1 Tax=Desulfovibrio desulfuricans (strain ATCC 27774 / DSM 6949 / MB) TaxID=525146 RepID=GMHA_DESDA|nr:RecName: Full=Phosphoheptose isomerase; AltName: Full=Sedoheptulose 7-phosphate isomerase [Desulfovibrio desulfuricans ATCC 27774]